MASMATKEEQNTTHATVDINGKNSESRDITTDGYEFQQLRVQKRSNYLRWDEYFMAVAFLSAQRSKDPNSQVGACIVNEENKIVGIGYNGMPNGCSDDVLPWARVADDDLDTKYPYVCHAEMNAILNKNSSDVKGCIIYVALFPCNECAKLIIQSGIKQIVYLSDKYHNQPNMKASRKLLDMAKVEYVKFEPERKTILVDFTSIEQSSLAITPQKVIPSKQN